MYLFLSLTFQHFLDFVFYSLCEPVSNIEDLYILMDKNHKGIVKFASGSLIVLSIFFILSNDFSSWLVDTKG